MSLVPTENQCQNVIYSGFCGAILFYSETRVGGRSTGICPNARGMNKSLPPLGPITEITQRILNSLTVTYAQRRPSSRIIARIMTPIIASCGRSMK